MIHPLWGESEFRGGHGACHGELSAEGEKFLREHLHPDYFFDQNGSFLRKMSVWKPSPSIYITYQEPESDKKYQIFSKIPRNRSQNGSFLRKMSVWKPSPSIYITYQEPESDKKYQIISKIPRNRSQNGSFLRKMRVWKPSPSIYITYQEPEYHQKNQIFSKIPRNRSLARCNCWEIISFSVLVSSFLGSANFSAARASRDSPSQ